MRKSPALVAILYHDAKINLDSILNILQKKRNKILIVLDGIKKISIDEFLEHVSNDQYLKYGI